MLTFRIIARTGDPNKKKWTPEEIEAEKRNLQNDIENDGEYEVDDIEFVEPLVDDKEIELATLRAKIAKMMLGDAYPYISFREYVLLFKEIHDGKD